MILSDDFKDDISEFDEIVDEVMGVKPDNILPQSFDETSPLKINQHDDDDDDFNEVINEALGENA